MIHVPQPFCPTHANCSWPVPYSPSLCPFPRSSLAHAVCLWSLCSVALGFGRLEKLSVAVDDAIYGQVEVNPKLLIDAMDVLRKAEVCIRTLEQETISTNKAS